MTLKYNSTTTLNRILEDDSVSQSARAHILERLLKYLGKTKADDEPVDLIAVLESNGIDDALRVLSHAMPDDRLARHLQAWCADQVAHLFDAARPDDSRIRNQIAMLRNDDATPSARKAAKMAAKIAVRDTLQDLREADTVREDLKDAARAAALAAGGDVAWTASALAACRPDIAGAALENQLRKMLGETT